MAKILSIGAGVMGTAITVPATKNGHDVTLIGTHLDKNIICLLYTSPSPRDRTRSRMPSSA